MMMDNTMMEVLEEMARENRTRTIEEMELDAYLDKRAEEFYIEQEMNLIWSYGCEY